MSSLGGGVERVSAGSLTFRVPSRTRRVRAAGQQVNHGVQVAKLRGTDQRGVHVGTGARGEVEKRGDDGDAAEAGGGGEGRVTSPRGLRRGRHRMPTHVPFSPL